MVRATKDYSKTIIYKIQHEKDETLLYVGSTTNFNERKNHHKACSNNPNYNQRKLYKMINQNGGWECFKMLMIKEFACNNKRESEVEEDRVMVELSATMNAYRACRSVEQWRIDNADKIYQYYIDNYDTIKANVVCECGCPIRKDDIARHKRTNKHQKLINSQDHSCPQ
jgi:hypothetical protein